MKHNIIKYYSTNLQSPLVSFREALLKGLAPDGGLYMPLSIPALDEDNIMSLHGIPYDELAFSVLKIMLNDGLSENDLLQICRDAYDFDVPVERVGERKYLMRLDQGPTASFKDFAARMMARLMNHFLAGENLQYTILTATSGDTGSAVASAFHGLSNIDVIILFPAGEVSGIQRKQMTTLHGNVSVIALDGKFDDCQRLVKKAFLDPDLSGLHLSSANSINIGRLLPQAVYYFHAWAATADDCDDEVIFSVPSGNFGNLMGGLIASAMGLPVKKFIISTNSNNEVPEFLKTGIYKPVVPSVNCISSAMNVGHPSNLARIIAFYGGMMNESGVVLKNPDIARMRKDLYGVSVSDEETRSSIYKCFRNNSIILEPHGAVAWKGIEDYERYSKHENDQLFVSLETAHPAKFSDEIKSILGIELPLPASISDLAGKKEEYIEMKNDYNKFRSYLITSNQ
ncbi:MAG: threonine synthase [Bacteroidota bacterium]